jgi:hypothetical protein
LGRTPEILLKKIYAKGVVLMYNGYDPNNVDYTEAYQQAERRVKAKIGFYSHLTAYIIVNGFLIAIYILTSFGYYPWFVWPMLGWGIGLAFHFASVFGFAHTNTPNVRKRMIEEEMRRMGVAPGSQWPSSQPFPPVNPEMRVGGTGPGSEIPPDRR